MITCVWKGQLHRCPESSVKLSHSLTALPHCSVSVTHLPCGYFTVSSVFKSTAPTSLFLTRVTASDRVEVIRASHSFPPLSMLHRAPLSTSYLCSRASSLPIPWSARCFEPLPTGEQYSRQYFSFLCSIRTHQGHSISVDTCCHLS